MIIAASHQGLQGRLFISEFLSAIFSAIEGAMIRCFGDYIYTFVIYYAMSPRLLFYLSFIFYRRCYGRASMHADGIGPGMHKAKSRAMLSTAICPKAASHCLSSKLHVTAPTSL